MASVILRTIIGAFTYGFSTQALWGWFVVPVFRLPFLSLAQAIGLYVSISFLSHQKPANDSRPEAEKEVEAWLWIFVWPGMNVLIGWVVMRFFL